MNGPVFFQHHSLMLAVNYAMCWAVCYCLHFVDNGPSSVACSSALITASAVSMLCSPPLSVIAGALGWCDQCNTLSLFSISCKNVNSTCDWGCMGLEMTPHVREYSRSVEWHVTSHWWDWYALTCDMTLLPMHLLAQDMNESLVYHYLGGKPHNQKYEKHY